jgi:hypothetical protein
MMALGVLLAATWILITHAQGIRRPRLASTPSRSGSTTTHALPTTTILPSTTTTTGPGALPQTGAFPSTSDPSFTAKMEDLWNGVSGGTSQSTVPAFLPEAAYIQLKAIGNAQADYTGRLVTEYEDDVIAAHALLRSSASAASLISVNVDSGFSHWVPPGTCYNRVGYFEVPNSRIVYAADGQVSSFGIASMISWRGEWYIVHLGAVLPSGSGGEVDDPQSGPGSPAYSSTC